MPLKLQQQTTLPLGLSRLCGFYGSSEEGIFRLSFTRWMHWFTINWYQLDAIGL
jgi:hypothetical protein